MANRKVGLFLRDDTPATNFKAVFARWRNPDELIRDYVVNVHKALRRKPIRPGSAELAATVRDKLVDLRALLDPPTPDPLALTYAGMLLVQAFDNLRANEVWEKPVEARRKQNAAGADANARREAAASNRDLTVFDAWYARTKPSMAPGRGRRDALRIYFKTKGRTISERTRRRLRKLVDADN